MTPAVQVEVLDLRHFSGKDLSPLLEAEGKIWNNLLKWNFNASRELLSQYFDSHILPGYVAVENSRVRGYVFCVYEGGKAVIGDVFALPSAEKAGATEIESTLLMHIAELLQSSPGVNRVETQLLLPPHGTYSNILLDRDFKVFERLFMELDLANAKYASGIASATESQSLQTRSWHDSDFAAAGRLIAECYKNHLDSSINDQYRSVAGSLRFLHNIVRFPGCGVFDASASRILVDPQRQDLAGLLLCSRVRQDVAHITQICIADRYRGRGFGSQLLLESASALNKKGVQAITLTVTEENTPAAELYRSRGFVTKHTFDAFVWDRDSKRT